MSPFDFPYRNGDFKQWVTPLFKRTFPFDMSKLVIKDDIIHNCPFSILPHRKVLVVGGGPSTLTFNNYDDYDHVWTMNKGYQLPQLRESIELLSVGAGVNLQDDSFQTLISNVKPYLAFEIHPKWFTVDQKILIKKLEYCSFAYHTNIYGKIGSAVRLINLAASVGAKDISFIGLDGPEAILQGQHAFEPGKTDLPSFCNKDNVVEIHQDQYDHFWQYIRNVYPDVKFNSIDKNNRYHVSLQN